MNDATPPPDEPDSCASLPIPTIRQIVATLLSHRVNHTVFVRYPKEHRLTGLMVFLIGESGGRFAPLIIELTERHALRSGSAGRIDGDEDINGIFDRLEGTAHRWFWTPMELADGRPGMIFAVMGDELCLKFAREFNARGLLTPLPNKEAAFAAVAKGGC